MKLTIDTETKSIIVEGNVSLNELMETIQNMFPHDVWKEYKLAQKNEIHYYPIMPSPSLPYWVNPVIYGAGTTTGDHIISIPVSTGSNTNFVYILN